MFQSMFINGKEYIPSAEIAVRYGYTSDYISRLAREGKIVAANINRKWFIEEKSLQEFIHLANADKELRSALLKKQRKTERLLHIQESKNKKRQENTHVHVALAQSFVVMTCGILVGMFGWLVSGSNLNVYDLAYGGKQASIHIAQTVLPEVVLMTSLSDKLIATVVRNK